MTDRRDVKELLHEIAVEQLPDGILVPPPDQMRIRAPDGDSDTDPVDIYHDGNEVQRDAVTFDLRGSAVSDVSADADANVAASLTDTNEQVINLPTTTLSDGNTFVQRYRVPDGVTFEVTAAGIQTISNTAPAGLTAEVYDDTNAVLLDSWNAKRTSGDPLVSVAGPVDLQLRMYNQTGGETDPSAWFRYREV